MGWDARARLVGMVSMVGMVGRDALLTTANEIELIHCMRYHTRLDRWINPTSPARCYHTVTKQD